MPRKSEWIQQLPHALEELRRFPAPVVDRATLERLLGVERRTAIRLLHQWGGFQAGKTFLLDRGQLLARLEEMAGRETVTVEFARRLRLADELERARRLAPGRKIRIGTALDVRHRIIEELPSGIHLGPGELRIEFSGAEDLLQKLFELSQAMANDFERFRDAVAG